MFILNSVIIDGFWGEKKILSNLFDDVNIYIGDNGTGKTTYINILYSLLSVDINLISNIQFDVVTLNLKNGTRTRKITITREKTERPFITIKYKIGKNVFEFPLLPKEIEYNRRRIQHPGYVEKIKNCKEMLGSLINISWISVYRDNYLDSNDDFYTNKREMIEKSPIDIRLEALMNKLTKLQLQLESTANSYAKKFQRDVLEGLLYNQKFDTFNFTAWSGERSENIKEGLIHAYRDLGAFDGAIEKKINEHSTRISKSLELVNVQAKERKYSVNDVLPLVLLNRTNYIITLSKKLEEDKNNIYQKLILYKEVIESFLVTKEIEFDQIRNGVIKNKNNGKYIQISSLSSGEKQLLIILTEALLQNDERYIFIADEPELSLHITWQKKLLKSIQMINPNSQIIVATHSPEIAAFWEKNIIDMETVFRNE